MACKKCETSSTRFFNTNTGEVGYASNDKDSSNEALLNLEQSLNDVIDEKERYKKAYHLLMDSFHYFPDDIQKIANAFLKELKL